MNSVSLLIAISSVTFFILGNGPLKIMFGHEYITKLDNSNIRRIITPKVGKPELQFLCLARGLLMSCVKFNETISNY